MKFDAESVTMNLPHRAQLAVTEAQGLALRCVAGALWITCPGGREDIVLQGGEQMNIVQNGTVAIQARGDSILALEAADGPGQWGLGWREQLRRCLPAALRS